MSTDFPLDSAIIAAIISVSVTGIMILYKEHRLEPNRWKKDAKVSVLEKQLQAYAGLVIFLKSAKTRGDNWGSDEYPHALVQDKDTIEFQRIFRDNYHLFSSKVNDEYLEAVKSDTKFQLGHKPKDDPHISSSDLSLNLSKMQELAEMHYNSLKTNYEKITGYEL